MRIGRSPRRARRDRRDQQGAAAVEFALVVPILLMLLFGIMDFGYLINRSSMVTNAARDGAREASLGASVDEVRAVSMGSVTGFPGVSVDVTCEKRGGGHCSYGDHESGDYAVVTVNYEHDTITPIGMFLGSSIDISRKAKMRFE